MSYTVHPTIRKLLHPSRFQTFRNAWDRMKVGKLPRECQKKPIQNCPIHVNYPIEMHSGICGGEGVIQGSIKKGKWTSPVPRYWSPTLRRGIVYSEVLVTYLSVVVTERALRLIDQHHGLDNYLLTKPAYDLKSLLAMKLKRKKMQAVMDKDFCHNNPERQAELYEKYKEYFIPRNELEWYGLSVDEALEKEKQMKEASKLTVPLKLEYRAALLEELKQAKINPELAPIAEETESKSWLSKLNPFASRQ